MYNLERGQTSPCSRRRWRGQSPVAFYGGHLVPSVVPIYKPASGARWAAAAVYVTGIRKAESQIEN